MFYARNLMKELRFRGNHTSNPKTYEIYVDTANVQLINSHDNTILTHFYIFFNAEKIWNLCR